MMNQSNIPIIQLQNSTQSQAVQITVKEEYMNDNHHDNRSKQRSPKHSLIKILKTLTKVSVILDKKHSQSSIVYANLDQSLRLFCTPTSQSQYYYYQQKTWQQYFRERNKITQKGNKQSSSIVEAQEKSTNEMIEEGLLIVDSHLGLHPDSLVIRIYFSKKESPSNLTLQSIKSIIIFKSRQMASVVNDYTLSLTNFFVPIMHSQLSFLQIQSLHAIKNQLNPNFEVRPLQSSDGKGKWNYDQQKQYVLFLRENIEEMRDKTSRKSKKVFLKMSKQVKTRTPDQCRSHHQKVLKYHNSLQQIISHYSQQVYNSQQIVGFECSTKSLDNVKTGLEEQLNEPVRVWTEGNKVRILINAELVNDY